MAQDTLEREFQHNTIAAVRRYLTTIEFHLMDSEPDFHEIHSQAALAIHILQVSFGPKEKSR